MRNEDAITILKMVYCENENVNSVLNNAIDTAISALESQRWIPVTEKLPERDDKVLVYIGEMDGSESIIQISKGWSMKYVSHWMPLPQPPYEVENGE